MRRLVVLILIGAAFWLFYAYMTRDRTFEDAQPAARRFIETVVFNRRIPWDKFAMHSAQKKAHELQTLIRNSQAGSPSRIAITGVTPGQGRSTHITCAVISLHNKRMARAVCHMEKVNDRWRIRDMTVLKN